MTNKRFCYPHNSLSIIALLIMTIVLLCECSSLSERDPYRHAIPNAEKYASYLCYDYHLYCLNAYDNTDGIKTEDEHGLTYQVYYNFAVGESDEEFICARACWYVPLAIPEVLIMQNPEQYVDVWNDWTVKEIVLYVRDLHDGNLKSIENEDEPARTPSSIVATTTDTVYFTEMKEFATADAPQQFDPPDDYVNEIHLKDRYVFYIRVFFNESANIVWESAVEPYYSEESEDRIICIDNGSMDGLYSKNTKNVSAEHLNALSSFIADEIDRFYEEHSE